MSQVILNQDQSIDDAKDILLKVVEGFAKSRPPKKKWSVPRRAS